MAGVAIVLSLAGVLCGVGLLYRYKPARLPAIGLLSAAALFWAMPIVQLVLLVISDPGRMAAETREAPVYAAGILLFPAVAVLWCVRIIYMLHKPSVRAEFDA